ncbi:MAG: hypothetical protein KDI71_07960 [Xanthomonadales bacterium]|nr:hypothetical protein [Xanthomonadales bacterium]
MNKLSLICACTAIFAALTSAPAAIAGPRDGGSLRFANAARQMDHSFDRGQLHQRTTVLPGENRSRDRQQHREQRSDRREEHADQRRDRREDRQEQRWDHYWYHSTYAHPYYAPGYTVVVLPNDSTVVVVDGVRYHYHHGIYYRAHGSRFVVVNAPLGAQVAVLPVGHYGVHHGHVHYRVYAGSYYLWEPQLSSYRVVSAPIGVIVPVLPEGAEKLSVNGQRRFRVGGVLYEPLFDGVRVVFRSVAVG